jgi:hypothetical protein
MERNLIELQRMNVLIECCGINICTVKYQNKQKEWHHATKSSSILKGDISSFLFLSRNASIKIRGQSHLKVGALVHGALVADLAGVEEDAVGAALLPPRHHHVLLHLQGGS